MSYFQKAIIVAGLVFLPFMMVAQGSSALPYNKDQIELDQEMSPSGTAIDKFKAIHVISSSLRGVRGANGVVYWVSKDKATLSAYKGVRLLWRTNVAEAFKADVQQPQIEKIVLASNVIFVSVSDKVLVEIDRETGQLGKK
ncbi:hypothetical protein [Pontibacter sp. HSC-36F09]|uniref:hypothetical protein n=1 Tax=Pontibacter sp. HSC-36F09 TaxID=2910966 RepID=UPI00209CA783|nr:hypothetical protein [Pontibacter sp. HSC-36F09]MCP2042913.1 nitrous oxide reductase accessory protein NosL [Pontibacter sp. HSC-36F09]